MRITVRDLMVPAAAIAKQTMTIAAARDLMLRGNATEAYVVDHGGKLLGIVPDYEFLKAELGDVCTSAPITTLLSTKLETVEADADIATVLPKFRESWCGRIAVVKQGRLIGRLTRAEVTRLVAHLRQIALVTEATAEATFTGPHFEPKRKRPTSIRRLESTSKPRGRRIRRLAAS